MIDLIRNYFTPGEVIGTIPELPSKEFWIECKHNVYVTLYYGNQFIRCFDNCIDKAEEIIEKIEKRTGKKFSDIPIAGKKDDFQGLIWLEYGWNVDFWKKVQQKGH